MPERIFRCLSDKWVGYLILAAIFAVIVFSIFGGIDAAKTRGVKGQQEQQHYRETTEILKILKSK